MTPRYERAVRLRMAKALAVRDDEIRTMEEMERHKIPPGLAVDVLLSCRKCDVDLSSLRSSEIASVLTLFLTLTEKQRPGARPGLHQTRS